MRSPGEHDIGQAKAHKGWPWFEEWCEAEGFAVDPDGHPDDWWAWWECFISGAFAQLKYSQDLEPSTT